MFRCSDVPIFHSSTLHSLCLLLLIFPTFAPRHSTPAPRHSILLRPPHYAPKAEMARRSIDGLRHARCGPVTAAIIRRAEKRAAFHHLARNLDVRRVWIVTFFSFCASGVDATTARMRDLAVLLIPVRRPLPDVAS